MRRDPAWIRWALSSARTWMDIERLVPVTGIDAVDRDHRGLLEYALALNLLAEDAAKGLSSRLLDRQRNILEGLMDAAVRHFAQEEAIIRQLGAPNLERQEREHAKIVATLKESAKDFVEGRLTISPGLRRAIFSWIVDHIEGTDYVTFSKADFSRVFGAARRWEDLKVIIRSTGVDSIDAEHRAIVDGILDAVDGIRQAIRDGRPLGEGPLAKIRSLRALCARHFSDEEAFMERMGVQGLDRQRETHSAFLERLGVLEEAAVDFGTLVPDADGLARELLAWLADHVNRLDVECLEGGDWLPKAFETREAEELLCLVRATGESLVDAQHREFVGLASAFAAALLASPTSASGTSDNSALAASFDELLDYARQHFADEEARFPPNSSAIAARHREEHAAISQTLRGYREALAQGRIAAASAARSLVLGWWVRHTNGTDIDTFGSAAMGRR